MPKLAKNRYGITFDLQGDLFRWKVDGYPALIFSAYYGAKRPQYGWPRSEIIFIHNNCFWWNDWKDIMDNGRNCFHKLIKSDQSDFTASFYHNLHQTHKLLDQELRRIAKIDFSTISLSALRKAWFQFFKIYTLKFWPINISPEVIGYAAGVFLEKKIKKQAVSITPDEISQLTVFPQLSFLLEEEYALLKIACLPSARERSQQLTKHVQNFSWILNGYHGARPLNRDFFEKRLKKLLQLGGIDKKLDHFRHYARDVRHNFKNIVHRRHLNSEIINLARLAQQGAYWQDQRKKKQLIATEYIVDLYRALARHLSLTLEQALFINWIEFDKFVNNHQRLVEIKERQRGFRFYISRNQLLTSKNNIQAIFNELEKRYSKISVAGLTGTVAYAGKVKGIVQVIKDGKDVRKFVSGRILVALMTSPDYIVAIKKAKAIITDDGGITSHAAIVARELKKPCIVGTKFASKVLHDGDLVEVDAEQGIVKKI